MTLAWGEVLGTLLRVVETWQRERSDLERVCVVRDLQGRIRLAIQAAEGKIPKAKDLEARIDSELKPWFAGPILWTGEPSAKEERRLAQGLIDKLKAHWPARWPTAWSTIPGDKHAITTGESGLWCGEQRARTKDIWVHEGEVSPPWPLHPKTPAIVSFYSFKGGVGRTTTLGIVARQLAREGHHVAVIDLDLEAPGLGRFFNVETERGVLDLLSEHAATGAFSRTEFDRYFEQFEEGRGRITVLPVGPMDETYVERLACLDYAPRANAEPSAVEKALRALLEEVKRSLKPSYIFLDARAGLHDLGGLSLHALAHVDILVGRANRATLDGFGVVLDALTRRRREQDLRVVVVQGFVPLPVTSDEHAAIRDGWAQDLYDAFERTIYQRIYTDKQSDLPAVSARDAMHFPWVVPQYDSIGLVDRIQDIDVTVLDATPFTKLRKRIVERCNRSALMPDMDEESDDGREVPE